MEKFIEELKNYLPFNEQEEKDRALMLEIIENTPDVLSRNSLSYHFTASAWVMNESMDKVLMAYHNIYDSWAWLGGHADGDADLFAVAMREANEESGISNLKPVNGGKLFSIEIVPVAGHEKKGKYVPSHLHLNLTYAFVADETDEIRIKADENSAVGWIDFDEIEKKSTEKWFIERIYKKLISKIDGFMR